jgi:uncharacterized protein (TIGR04255 family)
MEVTLRLGKPPVTEVGIDFLFDPNPQKQPWSLEVAEPYLRRFETALPRVEVRNTEEIRVTKRSPEGIPQELSGKTELADVRAHDDEETRSLRVANDALGYKLLRRGNDYPGFEVVLEEALDKLHHYVEEFQPAAVRHARVTYVDEIRIPRDSRGGVLLEDYFHMGIQLPDEPFGPIAEFAVKCRFPQTEGHDALQFEFATGPNDSDAVACFLVYWYCTCKDIQSLDPQVLSARLGTAHERIVECFMASFTQKGLGLFEPQGT